MLVILFKSAKMFDIDFTQFHWLYFIIAHSEMHFINLSHLKIPIGENVKFFLNIIIFQRCHDHWELKQYKAQQISDTI